jgi:drug/metabolite transporter (DMT)-like permease
MTQRSAVLGLTAVNVLWGLSFPLMKLANLRMAREHGITPGQLESRDFAWFTFQSAMFLIALRFAAAFVLLSIAAPTLVRRPTWREWGPGLAIGAAFFVGIILQNAGLSSIPASRSGFLTSLAIVFTPLFAMLLERRLPSFVVASSVIVALGGTAVLTGQASFATGVPRFEAGSWHRLAIGDLLTLLSAVMFAVQILTLDRFGKDRDAARFTPAMFAAASALAGFSFALSLWFVPSSAAAWKELLVDPPFLGVLAALVVFCSIFAFLGMNRFQPWISAEQAAVVYTLEPIFATLWAVALPALLAPRLGVDYPPESLHLDFWIGAGLILVATFFCLAPERNRGGRATEVPARRTMNGDQ